MNHDVGCPRSGRGEHSDAAKAASDAVNLHVTAGGALGLDTIRKWVAVRLDDGRSDGTLYDAKQAAVRHTDQHRHAYVCIPPGGMSVCAAESFMATQRKLNGSGFRLADPDAPHGGRDVIPRLTREDHRAQMLSLRN